MELFQKLNLLIQLLVVGGEAMKLKSVFSRNAM